MPSWTTSPRWRRRGLLGPEGLVAGRLQDPVERALVVARVVAGLGGRGVGEGPGRDQVAPPHLGRVEAQPGRQQVDRPLDHGGGLGPAGAPVGGHRGGVGGHALPGHLDPRDPVHARGHVAGRGHIGRGLARVGAAVGHQPGPQAGDAAVPGRGQLDLLDLGPAVGHGQHGLRAALDVADRAAQPHGQGGQRDLLGVGDGSWPRRPRPPPGRPPGPARAPCPAPRRRRRAPRTAPGRASTG